MRKQQKAIIILALWLTIVAAFMILEQWMNLELFFVLWFIGILLIIVFMESNYVKARNFENINFLIVIGALIFGAILVQKVIVILT